MKKTIVLIPSAYNERVMGDIENFIPFYKEKFELYIITNKEREKKDVVIDGIHYIHFKSRIATYLRLTADYVIDAGTIHGKTKLNRAQKRISVWHGIPYKKMFVDIGKEHVLTAMDYTYGIDLMISPSKWYTERFLRQSMLYKGEVLETSVSRTDSLYIDENEEKRIKAELRIPDGKKVALYAPTFRQEGNFELPFSHYKLQQALGDDWVIVVKLHYLNTLSEKDSLIDATDYSSVNNLLAISDLLITDYSSLVFDYSVLGKPGLLYQYDRSLYESERGFMFEMESYVDRKDIVFTEEELIERVKTLDFKKNNLDKVRLNFYPHQKENATATIVSQLGFDNKERQVSEVIFLINELNQIGGVHTFVSNLAKEFKEKYNARIILIGDRLFDRSKEKIYVFDDNNVDIKLSVEDNIGYAKAILKSTNGYIISCQLGVHKKVQKWIKNKKVVLMFHGDTQDVVDRNYYRTHLDEYNNGKAKNFKRLVLLTEKNEAVLKKELNSDIAQKTIHIENGVDTAQRKNLYQQSGDFAFVSRLDNDKNPMEILRVFSSDELNRDYRLHIYGDGSQKNEMEKYANEQGLENRVFFHGYVNDKEEIYRDKQGLLSVSLTEGLPLTFFEAMRFGIPIYAYDSFTSCRELVTSQTGVCIETGNTSSFVQSLNSAYDMTDYCADTVLDSFSNENVTKKWKLLFESLDAEEFKGNAFGLTQKKGTKKQRKSIKRALRESPLFKGNDLYARLSVIKRSILNKEENNDAPKISVIIPYFNNVHTVSETIKSVKKNGYANYEVLLIDDGSDNYPFINRFKDSRIRSFYKENGGLGSARNFGIDKAEGKYVMFLDSDDVLYPGAIKRLVSYAEKKSLAVVAGKTMRKYLQTNASEIWYREIYKKKYVNTRHNRQLMIDDTISTGKLYLLTTLRDNQVTFPDGKYEDLRFMGKVYRSIDRIGIVPGLTQIWNVYGVNSSISTSHTVENVIDRINSFKYVYELQENDEVMKSYYARQLIRHQIIASVNGYINCGDDDRRKIYTILREMILIAKDYIVDEMISSPSKKEFYKSLLQDDFASFNVIAEGFSCKYYHAIETGDLG